MLHLNVTIFYLEVRRCYSIVPRMNLLYIAPTYNYLKFLDQIIKISAKAIFYYEWVPNLAQGQFTK